MKFVSSDFSRDFIFYFGFIPANFFDLFGSNIINTLADQSYDGARDVSSVNVRNIAIYLFYHPSFVPGSLLTYSFIHAGWSHLLINSISLIAFGSIVARRIGPFRFVVLYSMAAIGGALAHFTVHYHDVIPIIGASAAISGIIAASLRFMFQPGEALSGFSISVYGQYQAPALSISKTLQDRRILIFILLWLGTNLVSGTIGVPLNIDDNIIAWESHIGGFLTGLVVFSILDKPINYPS